MRFKDITSSALILFMFACSSTQANTSSKKTQANLSEVKKAHSYSKSVLDQYLEAFRKGDVGYIESIATQKFIKKNGGKTKLQQLLLALKEKYKSAEFLDFKSHYQDQNTFFARAKIVANGKTLDSMGDKWFLIKKQKDGTWKIDDLLHDFDPYSNK